MLRFARKDKQRDCFASLAKTSREIASCLPCLPAGRRQAGVAAAPHIFRQEPKVLPTTESREIASPSVFARSD
ncbi:hypothetical protein D4R86_02755 [bacterium]|nr:MAG: hypothetical protein D4R86_02755 [bacterium]